MSVLTNSSIFRFRLFNIQCWVGLLNTKSPADFRTDYRFGISAFPSIITHVLFDHFDHFPISTFQYSVLSRATQHQFHCRFQNRLQIRNHRIFFYPPVCLFRPLWPFFNFDFSIFSVESGYSTPNRQPISNQTTDSESAHFLLYWIVFCLHVHFFSPLCLVLVWQVNLISCLSTVELRVFSMWTLRLDSTQHGETYQVRTQWGLTDWRSFLILWLVVHGRS